MSSKTYDRIAPLYDALDFAYEVGWKRRLRSLVFAGTAGRILDAGAGTGCNMPLYPDGSEVVALDNSAAMLERAATRAARLGRSVDIRHGDLLDTGFPDGHFDHIVATFVFCVLPEPLQEPALRELARICRPGGTIRILDYTTSRRTPARIWMRAVSPWLRFAFAARYDASYESRLPAAGLETVESRHVFGDMVKLLVSRPVSAAARQSAA
ncbi:class I SAM-dependent methyltransferase [Arenibaculum pallidiluteum]|uniref:class I SAM-dependent methyltransferase n=1 Tax=Arenibaculum pallidiluteum TaxID=2812559 RepID=UPI002E2E7FE1|nr:methyltransferase domain-containing protein [Arenibaculum pallidiluteum]